MMMTVTDFLSEQALRLLERPEDSVELRAEYESMGIIQVDGFADSEKIVELGERLYSRLSPLCRPATLPHQVINLNGTRHLTSGYQFSRIDPGFLPPASKERALYEKEFSEAGLTGFGDKIGERITPLVKYIVRAEVSYQRTYCFIYEEGDYIGPHNDSQTGWRINAQFPISLSAATGFRALKDGEFRLYYDAPGCLRILGPDVWHEVLPVLRATEEVAPHRVLLSLRFK